MSTNDQQHAMEITDDDAPNPLASTQGDSPQLGRLRRVVMSRVFDDEATPERIGRYEIASAIGSGAMGAVFAANDPELDRRVAVKLLHWSNDDAEGKRLLREGKALAKLSHPNVVQVYDVGTAEGRVFLAMELVRGVDLHRWLHARPRSWREVVDVFVAAGRGLAAAHAVGLVHRDFKPHNVLVGDDGVVKVADFGLVRAAGGPAALPAAEGERALDVPVDVPVETLTRTGAAVGTPAYMAPEQHLVLDTDARTDQFSFCVALYEGLIGERPFRAERLAELIEQVRSDRVEFPRRPWLPVALRRVIRRGLRARPADRFADMRALLDALERARKATWRGLALGVAVTGLVPLVALSGLGLLSQPSPGVPATAVVAEACDGEAKTGSIWDDAARDRVHARLVGVSAELGERAATTAVEAIDGYLETWREAYATTCEAAGASDDAKVLAQRLCLQSRLQETRGVISVLEQADATIVASVPQIVAALEPVAQCQGELSVVRTPSTVDDSLSFGLARARSLWHAGQPIDAYAAAESLAEQAAAADARVLESDAWLLAGMIAIYDLYGHERVERLRRGVLASALEAARTLGDPTRMLRAEVLIAGQAAGDAALEPLAARVEASGDAFVQWAYCYERLYSGESEAAKLEHARCLLAVATEGFGAGHRFVALSREIARIRGIVPRPTAEQQQAEVAEAAAMFGTDSPRALGELEALASQLMREGQLDEARIVLERMVSGWTRLVGPRSTEVGAAWRRIAELEWRRRGYEAALLAYQNAAAALVDNPTVDHEGQVDVLASVAYARAGTLLELGRAAEAVAVIEEAAPRRHTNGQRSLTDVMWVDLSGQARVAAGDARGALAEHVALRKTNPQEALELLDIGEGEALLALGRTEDARACLRRAWTRLDERKDRNILDELARARAGLALARTLAGLDAEDPEISVIVATALASLPIDDASPPTHLQLRDSLVALRR